MLKSIYSKFCGKFFGLIFSFWAGFVHLGNLREFYLSEKMFRGWRVKMVCWVLLDFEDYVGDYVLRGLGLSNFEFSVLDYVLELFIFSDFFVELNVGVSFGGV
jgi:hypothetical protein